MLHYGSYSYAYFFWILSPIKMKFGQILVCCMKNISNMFLAECWRLESSPSLFYDFIKITIQKDLAIFNGWHIWVSWERNIIFLQNKKILNLCFRWDILRSYRFVAEVNFNYEPINYKACPISNYRITFPIHYIYINTLHILIYIVYIYIYIYIYIHYMYCYSKE